MKNDITYGCLLLILFFFGIFNLELYATRNFDLKKNHPAYKGIKFVIPYVYLKEYNNLLSPITSLESDLDKIPTPDIVLDNLVMRFDEAIAKYSNNKQKLPSCLSSAIDLYLDELKSGKRQLEFMWIKGRFDWKDLRGDENGEGKALSEKNIQIFTAFKRRYWYKKRRVLTASLIFHELIHVVKIAYPHCFKKLDFEWEEATTEDGEVLIFGYTSSSTFYSDDGWGSKQNDCTYKIICKCGKCTPQKREEECELDPPIGANHYDFGMGLGGDSPDDNYSFSDGMVRVFDLAPEAVVFTRGYWQEALKLYGGLEFDGDNMAEKLFEATPFLVLPSGALVGKENDSAFKILLEQYVNLGGTIVAFAQQQGRHIHDVVPVPAGESLAAYGWREDQSCVNGAVYFDSVHPVMSSSVSQGLSAAVDGYFAEYPSTSSVLLKRTKNNEAALISYPYGNGTVILTSLYTDWGYAHSQATSAELKLVRDLITWAQNPRLPVSSYDPVVT